MTRTETRRADDRHNAELSALRAAVGEAVKHLDDDQCLCGWALEILRPLAAPVAEKPGGARECKVCGKNSTGQCGKCESNICERCRKDADYKCPTCGSNISGDGLGTSAHEDGSVGD